MAGPILGVKSKRMNGSVSSAVHKPTYNSWRKLRERCNNPKDIGWPLYGGRGIRVCERWAKYENFLADMGERPEKRTIDRKDSDGDYEPLNCRWATAIEQANNMRTTKRFEMDGRSQTLPYWCREFDIATTAVRRRLDNGWALSDALKTPSEGTGQVPIIYQGKSMLKWDFAKLIGMSPFLAYQRFSAGWTPEQIAAKPTRNRLMITIGEETMCVAAWAKRSGIPRQMIKYRAEKGWAPQDAVFKPLRPCPRKTA